MYRTMRLIRRFEETVVELVNRNEIGGVTHEYVGQEAVAAGTCSVLRSDDVITSTHRGHGHVIAKGGSVARMMAELLGRQEGMNTGHGGSMHMADVELGVFGANGIVAAGVPIAAGAALAWKYRGARPRCVRILRRRRRQSGRALRDAEPGRPLAAPTHLRLREQRLRRDGPGSRRNRRTQHRRSSGGVRPARAQRRRHGLPGGARHSRGSRRPRTSRRRAHLHRVLDLSLLRPSHRRARHVSSATGPTRRSRSGGRAIRSSASAAHCSRREPRPRTTSRPSTARSKRCSPTPSSSPEPELCRIPRPRSTACTRPGSCRSSGGLRDANQVHPGGQPSAPQVDGGRRLVRLHGRGRADGDPRRRPRAPRAFRRQPRPRLPDLRVRVHRSGDRSSDGRPPADRRVSDHRPPLHRLRPVGGPGPEAHVHDGRTDVDPRYLPHGRFGLAARASPDSTPTTRTPSSSTQG